MCFVILAIPISLYVELPRIELGCLLVDCMFQWSCLPPSISCVGYAFLLFREEISVHRLVKSCLTEEGKLYMFVSSLTQTNKKVGPASIR